MNTDELQVLPTLLSMPPHMPAVQLNLTFYHATTAYISKWNVQVYFFCIVCAPVIE